MSSNLSSSSFTSSNVGKIFEHVKKKTDKRKQVQMGSHYHTTNLHVRKGVEVQTYFPNSTYLYIFT